jgi:hypothetical protein
MSSKDPVSVCFNTNTFQHVEHVYILLDIGLTLQTLCEKVDQLRYLTDSQVQFTIDFCLKIYQYSWKMCLFIDDNTCGSCMMGHHLIFSALSAPDRASGGRWIGRGGPVI